MLVTGTLAHSAISLFCGIVKLFLNSHYPEIEKVLISANEFLFVFISITYIE